MSYIETLEEAAEVARTASQTASDASQIISDVANGDENTTVTTQSGPVKSVAKAIKDLSDQIVGGVTEPVRRTRTAEADQSTFVFDDISMASTTFYVNGLLRIDYTIDDNHQITFNEPLNEGDQVVAIERHLDNNIDNVLTVAEDYATQAEESANDAAESLVSMGEIKDSVDDAVNQASTYAAQASTAADDARRVSEAAQTDIDNVRTGALNDIGTARDDAVSAVTSEGEAQVSEIQRVSSEGVDQITGIRDSVVEDATEAARTTADEVATTTSDEAVDELTRDLGINRDALEIVTINIDEKLPAGTHRYINIPDSTGTKPATNATKGHLIFEGQGTSNDNATAQKLITSNNEIFSRATDVNGVFDDWQEFYTTLNRPATEDITGQRLTLENGEYIAASDDIDENNFVHTVSDPQGRVAFAVGSDGTVYAGRMVASEFFDTEGNELGQSDSKSDAAVTVKHNLKAPVTDINHVILHGQSQALGAVAGTPISTEQRYNNIMFNGGIRQFQPEMGSDYYSSFVPLVEQTYNQFTETPASGMADMLYKIMFDNFGEETADRYQTLYSSPAIGSSSIEEISEGTQYMDGLVESIQQAYGLAQSEGKTYQVPAVTILNGGTDQGNGTTATSYVNSAKEMVSYINGQIDSILGDNSNKPSYFMFQINNLNKYTTNYLTGDTNISMAQFDLASEVDGPISVVCPTYWGDFADNFHMLAASQRQMGGYLAVAYRKEVIYGEKFQPLRPVKTMTQGRIILVEFDVPYDKLVFDTDQVAEVDNFGFRVGEQDSNGNVTLGTNAIQSVEIVGDKAVKIICQNDVTSNSVISYAYNDTNGIGRNDGMRGNLRDRQGEVEKLSGYQRQSRLDNWCLSFIVPSNGYQE